MRLLRGKKIRSATPRGDGLDLFSRFRQNRSLFFGSALAKGGTRLGTLRAGGGHLGFDLDSRVFGGVVEGPGSARRADGAAFALFEKCQHWVEKERLQDDEQHQKNTNMREDGGVEVDVNSAAGEARYCLVRVAENGIANVEGIRKHGHGLVGLVGRAAPQHARTEASGAITSTDPAVTVLRIIGYETRLFARGDPGSSPVAPPFLAVVGRDDEPADAVEALDALDAGAAAMPSALP